MVRLDHALDHWVVHYAVEQLVNRAQKLVNDPKIAKLLYPFDAAVQHVEVVVQFRVDEQFDLTIVQHQIAALNVLHFLKDERNQTDDELVDELLLVLHLRNGALHEEADFLQDEVEVVVEQSELELGLRRSLEKLYYNLMRYYCQFEIIGGIEIIKMQYVADVPLMHEGKIHGKLICMLLLGR